MLEYCAGCKKKHNSPNWKAFFLDGNLVYVCSKFYKPSRVEHIPQRIKEERKKYVKSMLQPWRSGEASAEFIEAYPKQSKKMFTTKERIKAKNVWDDTPNIKNWRKTL